MWFHLRCLPTLLRDGLAKSSRAALSLMKRMCHATFEWAPLLLKLFMVLAGIAALLIFYTGIFLFPLLACVWIWQQITN